LTTRNLVGLLEYSVIKFQISNFKFQIARVSRAGFTLIELLVVIGILGILAAALIATIDPFEQLRKANDTSAKNTASEFLSATTRYYGSKGAYPWSTAAEGGEDCVAVYPANGTYLNAFTPCITTLVNQGELKASFANAGNVLKTVKVIQGSLTEPLLVCYLPTSKSGQEDPAAIYNASGVAQSANCKSQAASGGTDCWVCLQ
jgi:prepilin-type N-terminal cleavage/methylation domain-containing protein